MFPDKSGTQAIAGKGRRFLAGDPKTRQGTAGFAVLDLGVDFAPARIGVDVEVFAAPVERPGNNSADFVAV